METYTIKDQYVLDKLFKKVAEKEGKDVKEFMYMYSSPDYHWFKNINTREYTII